MSWKYLENVLEMKLFRTLFFQVDSRSVSYKVLPTLLKFVNLPKFDFLYWATFIQLLWKRKISVLFLQPLKVLGFGRKYLLPIKFWRKIVHCTVYTIYNILVTYSKNKKFWEPREHFKIFVVRKEETGLKNANQEDV